MKKFIALVLFFISPPFAAIAGFPEGENGHDLEIHENSFRLPCDEIGNDDCFARVFGVGACTWIFGIKNGKEPSDALKIADQVLIALLKGNNLDINSAFNKEGSIKESIKKESTYRINFCKEETKLAIPQLIKKLTEGIELDEEQIENLATAFPLQYLSMFEVMRKEK